MRSDAFGCNAFGRVLALSEALFFRMHLVIVALFWELTFIDVLHVGSLLFEVLTIQMPHYSLIKCNSELIVNAGHDHIKSLCARMVDNHKTIHVEPYKSYNCSALGNVFCSKGETGNVFYLFCFLSCLFFLVLF